MAPLLFPADVCHLGAQIGFTLGGLYGIIPCRKRGRGRREKYFRPARRFKSRLRDVPTAGVVASPQKTGTRAGREVFPPSPAAQKLPARRAHRRCGESLQKTGTRAGREVFPLSPAAQKPPARRAHRRCGIIPCRQLGRGRREKYFRPARRLKSRLRDVPTAGVVE